jgi:hypothetical protein
MCTIASINTVLLERNSRNQGRAWATQAQNGLSRLTCPNRMNQTIVAFSTTKYKLYVTCNDHVDGWFYEGSGQDGQDARTRML